MNQLTPYEVLIAEKAAHLKVPDLADSIWADIDRQLDIDLPEDAGRKTKPPGTKPGFGAGFYIIVAVVVALLVLMVYKAIEKKPPVNTKHQNTILPQEPLREEHPATDSNRLNNAPAEKLLTPVRPSFRQKDALNDINPGKTIVDTAASLQQPVIRIDSSGDNRNYLLKPPVNYHPDSLSAGNRNPGKKPKGVKGIGDEDYKIISKAKDSTNKKN